MASAILPVAEFVSGWVFGSIGIDGPIDWSMAAPAMVPRAAAKLSIVGVG